MNITTKHTSTPSGSGRVVARGGGKQKTISWDHSVSAAKNHGRAAAALTMHLFPVDEWDRIAARATVTDDDNGRRIWTV